MTNLNFNVGLRLTNQAAKNPTQIAIAVPQGSHRAGTNRPYHTTSMQDLENRATSIAAGLQQMGMGPGKRIALLVRFGEDFITLVFAVLKTGATLVLIDPGMGRKNLIQCLAETNPDGFIAIPAAQAVVQVLKSKFPNAKLNVTAGWTWGCLPSPTLSQLERHSAREFQQVHSSLSDSAAVIFTTGSTGPPKGVLYTHGTFNAQIDQVAMHYGIEPGGKDLSGFPLFGLFNAVMGTTTVIPDMNPIRPADVDPVRLLDAIDQWQINQSFGSPALWTKVGKYCQENGRRVPSLKRVLSAGAPVPPRILEQMRSAMHPDGCMYTPYGSTEALPIASIESRMVLGETAAKTRQGAGTCVGHRFAAMQWRVIAIDDRPLESIEQTRELPRGEIGELMVSGPVVSRQYVTRTDQNAIHKVRDGEQVWHRMGDVGYLDDQERFWFCGRKSHRVITANATLHTEPIEAIVNTHPAVYRSALVGLGARGNQKPTVVVELWPQHRGAASKFHDGVRSDLQGLAAENPICEPVEKFIISKKPLPTDIRHNSKIFREKIAAKLEAEK